MNPITTKADAARAVHILQHSLGIEGKPRLHPGHRNHYSLPTTPTPEDVGMFTALRVRGFVEPSGHSGGYRVTACGELVARSVAWRTEVAGWGDEGVCIVWAPTRAAARWATVRSLREAGYFDRRSDGFPKVRVVRAPEFDVHPLRLVGWPRPVRCWAVGHVKQHV